MTQTDNSLSGGTRASAVLVATLAILASASQSSMFMAGLGTTQGSEVVSTNLMISAAIMLGGVTLGCIAGNAIANKDPSWIAALCISVYLGVASYSIFTSTAQLADAGHATVAAENGQSTRATNLEEQIASNNAQVRSLQQQIDSSDPRKWKTARSRWSTDIDRIQRRNMVLMGQRDRVRESSTAQAYDDVEAMFGLSRRGWCVLIATLLELIPFTVTIVLSYYRQKERREGSAKKL